MKIEIDNDENITLFLKKEEIEDFDFQDIDKVEDCFRSLFSRLKEYYHLEIEGFYNIHAFIDSEEGMVLKLEREKLEYYRTFHQIEMRIMKEDTTFLYEVSDFLDFINQGVSIYQYQNKFYIANPPGKVVYNLYEFGRLIYEDTEDILKNGLLLTKEGRK